MKNKCAIASAVASCLILAAGCIISEQARYHTGGGGTSVRVVDNSLDYLTQAEIAVGSTLHSGVKGVDGALASTWHFASGLVTSEEPVDVSRLQKARRAEAARKTSKREIIKKLKKARRTVDAEILEEETLDNLGMYLVWDTPLAAVSVENIWVQKDMILIEAVDTDTRDHKLFAVDLENGYLRWVFRFLSPLDSRPTLGEDILWASSASTIYALEPLLGTELWKTRVNFTVSSPIFAIGHRQYVGTLEHAVYAIAGNDKYPDWHFGTFQPITAMPIVDGNVLYVASEDHTLYAFNYARKENLWQVRTEGPITADLTQDENCIYAGSEGFNAYAVSKSSGRINWTFPAQGPIRRPIWLLNDDTVLIRGEGAALYAVNKANGAEIWHDAEAMYPVAKGRYLYVLTENSTIKALDPATGEAAWEQSVSPFTHLPANLATNAITLCTDDGQLFLIHEQGGAPLKAPGPVARAEGKKEAVESP